MLTPELKQQILADPAFQVLKSQPMGQITQGSIVERAKIARGETKPEKGFFVSFVDRLKERAKDIFTEGKELKIKKEKGRINAITEKLGEAGLGAKLVADTSFDFVFNGLSKLSEKISGVENGQELTKNAALEQAQKFFNTESGKSVMEIMQVGNDGWEWLKENHPNLAESAKGLARVAEALPVVKAEAEGAKLLKETAETVAEKSARAAAKAAEEVGEAAVKSKNIFSKGYDIVKNKVDDITSKNPLSVVTEKVKPKTNTLEEIVSPKLNIGEKAKAIKEGRVTQGSDFPALGKAPDVVDPSKNAKQIADTIRRYVDDADKLDQFTIVNKADEAISGLAKEIKPKLKELQFTPTQKKELLSEWEYIKNTQAKSIFYNNPAVQKFQDATEEFLKQVNRKLKDANGLFREWTMADLWDFRIAYDNLKDVVRIKKLLKKADLSGEEQLLVDMWKENRNMINQFVKDSANSIGEDVGKKWLDMSDMYDAIDNISLKGDIDLTGEPDIIRRFITVPTKIMR